MSPADTLTMTHGRQPGFRSSEGESAVDALPGSFDPFDLRENDDSFSGHDGAVQGAIVAATVPDGDLSSLSSSSATFGAVAGSDVGNRSESLPHENDGERSLVSLPQSAQASKVIAKELAEIPYYERQQAYEDLHGVSPIVEETDEFICAKLDDMDVELGLVSDKCGYDIGKERDQDFMESKDFRVMFLRAENYDSFAATRRMVAWCDTVLHIFGPHVLGRPLCIADLSPEAYRMLILGRYQILAKPDSAGRKLIYYTKKENEMFSAFANAQVILYISWSAFRDAEAQKRGVVVVYQCEVAPQSACYEITEYLSLCCRLTNYLPSRMTAFHYMSPVPNSPSSPDAMQLRADAFQLSISKDLRQRFRTHFGTNDQNFAALGSYGIPIDQFPDRSPGSTEQLHRFKWIAQRMLLEGTGIRTADQILQENERQVRQQLSLCGGGSTSSDGGVGAGSGIAEAAAGSQGPSSGLGSGGRVSIISEGSPDITPTNEDVLMGRGRGCLEHPGNRFLRSVVRERSKEYDKANRTEKYDVAKDVVRMIYKRRGRFLKKSTKTEKWEEVTWCVAREKVAHAFRKRRELDLAKNKKGGEAASAAVKRSAASKKESVSKSKAKRRTRHESL